MFFHESSLMFEVLFLSKEQKKSKVTYKLLVYLKLVPPYIAIYFIFELYYALWYDHFIFDILEAI